jgi:hypothetical protein
LAPFRASDATTATCLHAGCEGLKQPGFSLAAVVGSSEQRNDCNLLKAGCEGFKQPKLQPGCSRWIVRAAQRLQPA